MNVTENIVLFHQVLRGKGEIFVFPLLSWENYWEYSVREHKNNVYNITEEISIILGPEDRINKHNLLINNFP